MRLGLLILCKQLQPASMSLSQQHGTYIQMLSLPRPKSTGLLGAEGQHSLEGLHQILLRLQRGPIGRPGLWQSALHRLVGCGLRKGCLLAHADTDVADSDIASARAPAGSDICTARLAGTHVCCRGSVILSMCQWQMQSKPCPT